ncbi:hypothetical protein TNCV_2133991 [Trichonephila clavipes]|nr:hypothetical protein TNCV_2133991 [Trichonephila clavipes]
MNPSPTTYPPLKKGYVKVFLVDVNSVAWTNFSSWYHMEQRHDGRTFAFPRSSGMTCCMKLSSMAFATLHSYVILSPFRNPYVPDKFVGLVNLFERPNAL